MLTIKTHHCVQSYDNINTACYFPVLSVKEKNPQIQFQQMKLSSAVHCIRDNQDKAH